MFPIITNFTCRNDTLTFPTEKKSGRGLQGVRDIGETLILGIVAGKRTIQKWCF